MWRVFGDALHMSGPARVAVFGFVELAVAVSAIRARRALRETGSTGVDGAAVWVLAGLSAALSALDADSGAAVLLRLAAPLVAAWLWERGLAPDRRQLQVRRLVRVDTLAVPRNRDLEARFRGTGLSHEVESDERMVD